MFAFLNIPAVLQDAQKLTLIFEGRERFQRRVNRQFSNAVNDCQSFAEQRYRVGFGFKNGDKISGRYIQQYAHTETWGHARNFSTEANDTYVAEVNIKQPEGTYTGGRQILKIGSQRLFEESQFGQRSKSFDLLRYRGHGLDVWAGKVGYSPVITDRARLVGATYDSPLGQTLAVYKHDQWIKHQDFWTFDQRWAKNVNGFDVDLEGAYQTGRTGGKSIQAHFLHGRIGHPINQKWGAYVDFSQGSGGSSGNTTHDFDFLYGSTHGPYGLADVVGPTNLNDLEIGLNWNVAKGRTLFFSYNKYNLYDRKDGMFGTGGSIASRPGGKFIDPTGMSGTDIGQEFDIAGRFDLNKRLYAAFEVASVKPGGFIRAFNGSHTKDQAWGILYLMYKY